DVEPSDLPADTESRWPRAGLSRAAAAGQYTRTCGRSVQARGPLVQVSYHRAPGRLLVVSARGAEGRRGLSPGTRGGRTRSGPTARRRGRAGGRGRAPYRGRRRGTRASGRGRRGRVRRRYGGGRPQGGGRGRWDGCRRGRRARQRGRRGG